jgi:aspartate racemase
MKTIGMLGGMSWESTAHYYQALNQGVKKRLGGHHSAEILMRSVDFSSVAEKQEQGDWQGLGESLAKEAKSLEVAGADFVLICTNTMHKVAPEIQQSLNIPILHIADVTAKALAQSGVTKVGLLGTAFTMEQEFYKQRLVDNFGIEVVVPNGVQRKLVHDVIYQELVHGIVNSVSKSDFLVVIDDLRERGVEAVILGCTEIAMLVQQQDTVVPLFDTTELHAQAAIDLALS